MPSVTLNNSQAYPVYADVEEANLYLAASLSATAWRAADENTKGMALINATRILDRQCWLGDPTGLSGQVLAWPRTNTGIDGVVDDEVPADISDGSIELASALLSGNTAESNSTPGKQTIEVLKAGSVLIQYFRDAENLLAQQGRFPLPVQELVGRYMCGNDFALAGSIAYGTTCQGGDESVTGEYPGYNEGV